MVIPGEVIAKKAHFDPSAYPKIPESPISSTSADYRSIEVH